MKKGAFFGIAGFSAQLLVCLFWLVYNVLMLLITSPYGDYGQRSFFDDMPSLLNPIFATIKIIGYSSILVFFIMAYRRLIGMKAWSAIAAAGTVIEIFAICIGAFIIPLVPLAWELISGFPLAWGTIYDVGYYNPYYNYVIDAINISNRVLLVWAFVYSILLLPFFFKSFLQTMSIATVAGVIGALLLPATDIINWVLRAFFFQSFDVYYAMRINAVISGGLYAFSLVLLIISIAGARKLPAKA